MVRNQIKIFLVFFFTSLITESSSQILNENWNTIYNQSGLKIEVQLLISENSCFNGLPTLINYRYNGKLKTEKEFVNWKINYINCNGEEYVHSNGTSIGGSSIINLLGGGFLEDVIKEDFDDQITNKKITNNIYNITTNNFKIKNDEPEKSIKGSENLSKDITYKIGISPWTMPNLDLDYISHFGENSCFYFTYDISGEENEKYTEIYMEDFRLEDLENNLIYDATYTDLPNSDNPRIIYRGSKSSFKVCFDRFPGDIKKFSLKEKKCEAGTFCFLNIDLNNYRATNNVDWRRYKNTESDGTMNFYINQSKLLGVNGKIKIYIEKIYIGELDEFFQSKEYSPSCGDATGANLALRLEEGIYNYNAENEKYTWSGEFEIKRNECKNLRLWAK